MHMNMLVCRLTRIQDTAYVKRRQQSTSANRARVDHRQSAFVWSFAHRMFVVQSLPPRGAGVPPHPGTTRNDWKLLYALTAPLKTPTAIRDPTHYLGRWLHSIQREFIFTLNLFISHKGQVFFVLKLNTMPNLILARLIT